MGDYLKYVGKGILMVSCFVFILMAILGITAATLTYLHPLVMIPVAIVIAGTLIGTVVWHLGL